MPRTAILYVAERCNQSCVFCLEEDASWRPFVDPSTEEVFALLGRLRARGAEHITFMGGETFFRKDLGAVLTRAKAHGYTRVGVTTNGTVLSKPGFVRALAAAGLDFVEISIHGHTEALANAIGGAHFTFARQRAALAELAQAGVPAIVNVVVCRENAALLRDVVGYVAEGFPALRARFKLKFVSLQGLAAERAEAGDRPLHYEDVDFAAAGDDLERRDAPFWFYNAPLCRLGAHAARAHEVATLATDEAYFDFDHRDGAAYYDSGHQLEGRIWPERPCGGCALRPICPGIEASYARAHGPAATLGLAASARDPLPLLEGALRDRRLDASRATARLAALARAPRPTRFVPPLEAGGVRFSHDAEEEPLDVRVEPRAQGVRCFAASARFALAYRPWSRGDAYARPRVASLLRALARAMNEADRAGASLEGARDALARAAVDGWIATRPHAARARRVSLPLA
ncbi:MAG TPA: radical SAM protein [Minicystis sp.]|nr:radical SAM protein [Minicystis sp.]